MRGVLSESGVSLLEAALFQPECGSRDGANSAATLVHPGETTLCLIIVQDSEMRKYIPGTVTCHVKTVVKDKR